jgi:hypothetical protein
MLSFTVCLAVYVGLDRAKHSVEICGAWFAAIEIYENLCALWPTMESMAVLYSMALKTGFAAAFSSSKRWNFRRDLIGSFPGPNPSNDIAYPSLIA